VEEGAENKLQFGLGGVICKRKFSSFMLLPFCVSSPTSSQLNSCHCHCYCYYPMCTVVPCRRGRSRFLEVQKLRDMTSEYELRDTVYRLLTLTV